MFLPAPAPKQDKWGSLTTQRREVDANARKKTPKPYSFKVGTSAITRLALNFNVFTRTRTQTGQMERPATHCQQLDRSPLKNGPKHPEMKAEKNGNWFNWPSTQSTSPDVLYVACGNANGHVEGALRDFRVFALFPLEFCCVARGWNPLASVELKRPLFDVFAWRCVVLRSSWRRVKRFLIFGGLI